MTILGRGDLSPPRRHRSRRGPVVLALAGLAALAAGAWFGWHTWHGGGPRRVAVKVCVTPSAAPSPAAAGDVAVSVLNATDHAGLAHQVAAALRARGFRVSHVGNTTATVPGTATVTYPAAAEAAARTVAEQVSDAQLVVGSVRTVTLALGDRFTRLATDAEVAAAQAHDRQAASPRPPVCSAS